jgi:hypothetical protein
VTRNPLADAARTAAVPLLALLVLGNMILFIALVKGHFDMNDFRLYLAGANVAQHHGWANVYDPGLERLAVSELRPAGPWYPLLTPLPIVWLVTPLTVLPYPVAYAVWVCLLACLMLVAFRLTAVPDRRYILWVLALGPLAFALYEGQASVLVAAAVILSWHFMSRQKHLLAGLALTGIILKPHLALAIPFCLLLSGRWRVVVWFSLAAALTALAAAVSLGLDGVHRYINLLLTPLPWEYRALSAGWVLGNGLLARVVQACAVIVAAVVCLAARRSQATIPISAGVLVSAILADYWHPQDYLILAAAAAIQLRGGPPQLAVPLAATITVLSVPFSPLTVWQESYPFEVGWLLLELTWLAALTVMVLTLVPRTDAGADPWPGQWIGLGRAWIRRRDWPARPS